MTTAKSLADSTIFNNAQAGDVAAINTKISSAVLAGTTGASLVGTASGKTVEQALAAIGSVDLTSLNASIAAKVDTVGALAAAVGTNATQAPSRALLLAQTAASLIGHRVNHNGTILTGSRLRTLYDKLSETRILTPEEFGAVGDVLGDPGQFTSTNGVNPAPTDDTAALQAMFSNVGPNVRVLLSKVYAFKATLVIPQVNYVTVEGLNEYTCGFLYTGTSTTIDLIQLGTGASDVTGWNLRRFIIDSSISMTAGAALHVTRATFIDYDTVVLGGKSGVLQTIPPQTNAGQRLFNGLFAQGFQYCHMSKPDIAVKNTGIGLCGYDLGSGNFGSYGTNFTIYGGKRIGGCNVGVLIGGGVYQATLDEVDIIGNVTNNVRITQELYAHTNALLLAKMCVLSAVTTGDNVYINDPNAAGENTTGYLDFQGTRIAGGPLNGINIVAAGNNNDDFIHLNGCHVTGFTGDAIRVGTNIPRIEIQNSVISGIVGAGIRLTFTSNYRNVRVKNVSFRNVTTPYVGNIEGLKCTWTPVATADTGTLPSQPAFSWSEYIETGPLGFSVPGNTNWVERVVHFTIKLIMPASVAGASGQLILTLPYAPDPTRKQCSVQGIGTTSLGPLYGLISGTNSMRILPLLGSSTIKANEEIEVSGWYFAADTGMPS